MSIRLTAASLALLLLAETCRADGCDEHPGLEPPLQPHQFEIVSAFGLRRNPFSGRLVFHTGLDLTGPSRTAVLAMRDGHVMSLEPETGGAFTIAVRHCGGWMSEYRHVVNPAVVVGQRVLRGQRLASAGHPHESGRGARIHVGLSLNGRPVDPAPLFAGFAQHRR